GERKRHVQRRHEGRMVFGSDGTFGFRSGATGLPAISTGHAVVSSRAGGRTQQAGLLVQVRFVSGLWVKHPLRTGRRRIIFPDVSVTASRTLAPLQRSLAGEWSGGGYRVFTRTSFRRCDSSP